MATRTQRGALMERTRPARLVSPRRVLVAVVMIAAYAQEPVAGGAVDRPAPATGSGYGTFYGPAVPVGEGTARTYVTLGSGVPEELGIELDEGALLGLAAGGPENPSPEHREQALELPKQAAPTPYRHAVLAWSPGGHPAPYDQPHLDFRFFLLSVEERRAIDPADPAFGRGAARLPAPGVMPARYAAHSALAGLEPALLATPGMGLRWLDVASPELRGEPFTRAFLYGSWNGRMAFAEPVVALEHLRRRPDVTTPLPAPERYDTIGFHPGAYRVYWHAEGGRYRVALTQFAMR